MFSKITSEERIHALIKMRAMKTENQENAAKKNFAVACQFTCTQQPQHANAAAM
jgi:hypothetical protein